ncbi:NAD(P)-dependent oxidoreductase [Salininema proteolyticum]|uniref:NAD(P)-dependent oxidoreductase n=1 Tax=Salininema proteolyticum TaxID=1607685 RepID=UPI00362694D6
MAARAVAASTGKRHHGSRTDRSFSQGRTTMTTVSVIGLGRLGSAIAERLIEKGHTTTVWNRSTAKAEPLAAAGATVAGDVAEALEASSTAFLVLSDLPAADELLASASVDLGGKTIVNVATSRPDQSRALGERLSERGAAFVDAAVFGVPQTVGTDENLLVYSGEASEGVRGALDDLGDARHLGEDVGLAAAHDMAVLAAMYGLLGGLFQAAAMMRAEGVEFGGFSEQFMTPWLRSIMDLAPALASEIDSGEYSVTFSDLSTNRSGLEDVIATAEVQKVDPSLLAPLRRVFADQVADGHGDKSFTRAVEGLVRPVPSTSGPAAT